MAPLVPPRSAPPEIKNFNNRRPEREAGFILLVTDFAESVGLGGIGMDGGEAFEANAVSYGYQPSWLAALRTGLATQLRVAVWFSDSLMAPVSPR